MKSIKPVGIRHIVKTFNQPKKHELRNQDFIPNKKIEKSYQLTYFWEHMTTRDKFLVISRALFVIITI